MPMMGIARNNPHIPHSHVQTETTIHTGTTCRLATFSVNVLLIQNLEVNGAFISVIR